MLGDKRLNLLFWGILLNCMTLCSYGTELEKIEQSNDLFEQNVSEPNSQVQSEQTSSPTNLASENTGLILHISPGGTLDVNESQEKKSEEESEKKRLKQYLRIPELSQVSLELLKKEKANIDIFGCQLLVEEVKKVESYRCINDALLYYLNVHKLAVDALTWSPFLYTLMRMLIDHSEELAETIKAELSSVLENLGKTYSTGNFYDAGKDIYEWMLEHDPDALGEYHM